MHTTRAAQPRRIGKPDASRLFRYLCGVLVVLGYFSQSIISASGSGGSGGGGSGGAPPSGGGIPAYPTSAIGPAQAPISLPGGGSVSDTGSANYTIPIQVPAGAMGMQPSLALSYGGGLGNGALGVGFALSGESSIAPCHKTFASEGEASGVAFAIDDAYCLDGQKLLLSDSIPNNDGTFDRVYRTEIESFARIVAHSASALEAQPVSFEVWHRDGRRATYEPIYGTRRKGVDAHSPPLFAGPDEHNPEVAEVAVAYPMRRLDDRSGNRIEYLYSTFAESAADFELTYRLEEIRYAHSGQIVRRKVVFKYDNARPDPIVRQFGGVRIATRKLLSSIEAHAPNPVLMQKVWSYHLAYETGVDTSRSRLISVTQKDQFGEESWARRFEWTDASAAQIDHATTGVAEFDDASLSVDEESQKKNIAGSVAEDQNYHPYFSNIWVDRSDVRLVVVDLDGDGLDEVIYRTRPTRLRDYWDLTWETPSYWEWLKGDFYKRGTIRVRRSHQGGVLTQVTDVTDYLEPTNLGFPPLDFYGDELWQAHLGKSRFADLDGDGRLDLLLARTFVDHDYHGYREYDPNDTDSIEYFMDGVWVDDWGGGDNWGHWSYGYADVGPFDLANAGWSPPPTSDWQDKFTHIAIQGSVWRGSASTPDGLDFRLFNPPFQNILADLDGDGLVERTDAFYYRETIDTLNPSVNWLNPANYDFPYQTELTSRPGEVFGFAATTGLSHDARWSCGNGRAVVMDYEGDGRGDILAARESGAIDAYMGDSLYARLHTAPEVGLPPKTSETSELWAGGCDGTPEVLVGDWNGDGLEDVLYPPGAYNEPVEIVFDPVTGLEIDRIYFYDQDVPLVRWNLGNGFGPLEEIPVDDAAIGMQLVSPQPVGATPVGWDLGTRTVDLNRDGRTDILAMRFADKLDAEKGRVREPKVVFAYLSTGTGFHAIQLANWPSAEISKAEGFTTFQLGDVTGDGATDIIWVDSGHIVTTELAWRTQADLLARVMDDGAAYALEEFAYDSAWWGGGERPAFEACDYPTACPKRAFTVVRRHSVFAGTMPAGGPRYRETLHTYVDPRVDQRGRGFLGFAEHRMWDREVGAETVRTFNNAARVDQNGENAPGAEFYPYAMIEVAARTTIPDMPLPTDLELQSGSPNFPGTSGDTVAVLGREVVTETDYEMRFEEVAGRWSLARLPSGWSRTESDVETTALDVYQEVPHYSSTYWQTLLRGSSGSTTYDDYGNATYSVSVTNNGDVVTTVESEFENRTTDGPDADDDPDWLLGLATRVDARSSETATAEPARIQRATYDPVTGQLTSIQNNAQGDSAQTCVMIGSECELLSSSTTFSDFDVWGNPQHIKTTAYDDPTVRNTYLSYDADGVYPVQAVNALGHIGISLIHPALGVPLLQVDANGVTTANTFDGFGRPLTSSRPGSATVARSYTDVASADHVGLKVTTVVADRISRVTTDELGRPVLLSETGFGGTWIYRDVEYDHFGNTSRSSIPAAAVPTPATPSAHQALDRLGRPLKRTSAEGHATSYAHAMFTTTSVDPEGHETYVETDAGGRVLETGHLLGSQKTDTLRFRYGPFDQVLMTEDVAGTVTSRAYNPFGRLVELADPDSGTSTYAFDGFGQLVEETRATGDVIVREYDSLGRLWKTSGPDGFDELTHDVGVGAKGRLSSATSLDGAMTVMEYDSYGRPSQTHQTFGGVTHSVVQHYDAYGRLARLFYPETPGSDRFKVSYEYGLGGHLTKIADISACNYSTNPNDPPPPGCMPERLWEVLARNENMSLTSAKYGNNQTEARTYGPASGLLERLQVSGTDTYYDYDKDGNLAARWGTNSLRTEEFTYDELHRIDTWTLTPRDTGPTAPSILTEYDYTSVGDLRKVTRAGVDVFKASFGAESKPHALKDINGGAAHEYDDSGRFLSGDGREVFWTHIDRPRSIEVDGDFRSYTYDAFGSRVVRQTDDGTISYVGKLYEHRESISSGNSHVFLVHGEPGVVAQISYESTGKKRRFIGGDNLSSATVVMLETSTVEQAYFDPFGARIAPGGAPAADADPKTTFGFTGHEEDDESLVNMGGRIYDRAQYRFLSPDPIISNPLFGQSYNPYSYVLNNPLRYADPTGFQAVDENGQYVPPTWTSYERTEPNGTRVTGYYDPNGCSGPCSMQYVPDAPKAVDGDAGHTQIKVLTRPAARADDGKSFEERDTDATLRGFSRGAIGFGSVGDFVDSLTSARFWVQSGSGFMRTVDQIQSHDILGFVAEQAPPMVEATRTLVNDTAAHEDRAEAGGFIVGKYASVLAGMVGLRGKVADARTVTLFHGHKAPLAGGLFDLEAAKLNIRPGTPTPGIYMTNSLVRAATGYATPAGFVTRVRVPANMAAEMMQESPIRGPRGVVQHEWVATTEAQVGQLNTGLQTLPQGRALLLWLGGE